MAKPSVLHELVDLDAAMQRARVTQFLFPPTSVEVARLERGMLDAIAYQLVEMVMAVEDRIGGER
jgi:hypothetical protein